MERAARMPSANRPEKPGLKALLAPKNSLMVAVEKALLRGGHSASTLPIAEQTAARLAGLIALDVLPPGHRLLETELSELLHVSRAPVREALRILERDRLVDVATRRGATVCAPDEDELQDIFEIRSALFAILLERVMRERHAELSTLFKRFLPRMEAAAKDSSEAFAVQSFLFNLAVADLCDNRLVVDQLTSISLRTLRYVRLGLGASRRAVPDALARWRAFASAVERGDSVEASEAARRRIEAVRDLAVRVLDGETLEGR